jgi:hypothetical protein
MTDIKQALQAVGAADESTLPYELLKLEMCLAETRNARLELDRDSAKLKALEDQAKSLIIDLMMKHKLTLTTESHTISVSEPRYVPHVDDWAAFHAHILATGDLSLLERRPAKTPIREHWDGGETVPGVQKYPVYELVRTKVTHG